MISQLTGKIISSDEKSLIVDVNGVGYQVFCSLQTLLELKDSNETITILTEFIVREDSQSLFGFSDPLEKQWFNLLISVQGVGAKAAIAILSSITIDELGYAISNSEKSTSNFNFFNLAFALNIKETNSASPFGFAEK